MANGQASGHYVAENGAGFMHRGPIQPLRNINQAATYAQRCCMQHLWAHKMRNILNKVRKADHDAVKAVACLCNDLDDLLTCFRYKTPAEQKLVRTTNAIERRFREIRRRTRPMGTFQDKVSMDRILYAVFTHENKSQGISAPVSLTHKS